MRKLTISNLLTQQNYLAPLCLTLILVSTFIAYIPAINNDFVNWDDQYYITLNPLIQQPTIDSLRSLLTQVISLNYHPLTMISFWINSKLSGIEAAQPFILTNIIVHLINTLLVYIFTLSATHRNLIIALTTAAIFGLHPMHVESVAWVSERKDVVYSLFFLFSLITYVKSIDRNHKTWLFVSFLLFILACLSKAMAVSLLPCLLLIDYKLDRDFKKARVYLEKFPYLIAALIFGCIALSVQSGGDFYGILTTSETADAINPTLSMVERFINAAYANTYYLKSFIYPSGFSAFHPYSAVTAISQVTTLLVSVGSLGIFIIALFKKWKHLAFGIGFYMATIALVSQIIPVGSAIVAERYTYLPYIGLAYLLGLGCMKLVERFQNYLPVIFILILVSIYCYQTMQQSDRWQDHTTLFTQVIEQYPNDAKAREYLASGFWQNGKIDSALHHIQYAIQTLGLESSSAFELLANCHADKGNSSEAIAFFNKAIHVDESNVTARYHRGIHLLNINPALAIEDFNYCQLSNNAYIAPLIHAPRGRAYGMLGEYHKAVDDFNQAINLFPDDPDNLLDRALTYEYLGRFDKAREDYYTVLQLQPDNQVANSRTNELQRL